MKKTTFSFSGNDGVELAAVKWTAEGEVPPRAVVQIAHGMAEHIDRYDHFAEALTAEGFAVYGHDHRGHGKTATRKEDHGYFADENGFEKAVEDMERLTSLIEQAYPETPVLLLGHSMGSFLARRYIQCYGRRLTGVILSGTGGDPGFLGKIGKITARIEKRRKGPKSPSPLLDKLSFGSFNKKFKPNRTAFDWLSRDEEEVDKYIGDPDCGNVFSAGFFYDLLTGLELIHEKGNVAKTPKQLPIILLSGTHDPVGDDGQGVKQVYQLYKDVGVQQVDLQLYEGARHEILNETNKEEVYRDIINWINKTIQTKAELHYVN